jgi:hypothetical protein
MLFLRITDPAERDFLVQELINTCQAIMQEFINDRLGDAKSYQDSTELSKPLTEKIGLSAQVLEPTIKDLKRTVKALPASITESMNAIPPPLYPAIEAIETSPQQPPIARRDNYC